MDKKSLINNLINFGYLKTPRIIEAFRAIDRQDFVLPEFKDKAYVDTSLSIGYDQTISQPLTIAIMLEMLQPKIGDKILDIGSGSGYQTALLANIVGKGKVFAIERIRELYEFGCTNISRYNFIKNGIVKFFRRDGSQGLREFTPYDRIIAAAAADSVPQSYKDQIKIGGRIVMPINESDLLTKALATGNQDLVMLEKQADGSFKEERQSGFAFVPLISSKEVLD